LSRRYTLKSAYVFRYAMKNPGRGTPYGYDTLAKASGCGRGLIEKLATGRQKTADVNDAHALVEAFGIPILFLFAPKASSELDDSSPADPPTKKE
jgi:transcriptional regulator with XRE-family HTH domain